MTLVMKELMYDPLRVIWIGGVFAALVTGLLYLCYSLGHHLSKDHLIYESLTPPSPFHNPLCFS